MAFPLPTVIPLGSKSRVSHPSIYTGFDELYNNNDSRDRGGYNYHDLWVRTKQMVWGKHNPYLRYIRRCSRFRFGIYSTHSWRPLLTRNSNKSSQSGTRNNRDRKRNRHYLYYYLFIYIFTIIGVPAYADDGETNNTANPVAAATGNVTNQAVQFQNNGAPSRQVYGPNISCNGATMTFSPFYMGNHVKPGIPMDPDAYTKNENWGGQINFMVPLDGSLVERCKAIADRQQEKMRLEYELARALKCGELMQKGFMIKPRTRVWNMCSDIIPIKTYQKQIAAAQAKANPPPPKKWYQKLNPFKK